MTSSMTGKMIDSIEMEEDIIREVGMKIEIMTREITETRVEVKIEANKIEEISRITSKIKADSSSQCTK